VIKTRRFEDKNYYAIFNSSGKTIRMTIDPSKPIQELDYPEFYDVSITNYCKGGCPYCYQNSCTSYSRDLPVLERFKTFFECMTPHQRPFQVAFGGGEPTDHVQFEEIIKTCRALGIMPNYTTNGLNMSSSLIKLTQNYCGGVAVSTHKHLAWEVAAHCYIAAGIRTNLHIIISDKDSVDDFLEIYKKFPKVHYFVLLPYMRMGRASRTFTDFGYLFEQIKKIDYSKIAFGANFYPYLQDKKWLKMSLYEPELLSKYLNLPTMKLYKSSFNLKEIK